MIRNLLFDLGGVLIDLEVHRSINALLRLIKPQQAADGTPITGMDLLGGGESKLMQLYQTGSISTDAFIQTIQSVCQEGTTREQILEAWYAMLLTIPTQRIEMLHKLKEKGYSIYILSNINEAHVDWVASHYPELQEIAEKIFYSNEIRIAKPDDAAYRYVLKHARIRADETLYFDDLEQNIQAGQRNGFICQQVLGDEWLKTVEDLIKNQL